MNRDYPTGYNRKRVRRVMELQGWTLPARQRRNGHAHTGRVAQDGSNERWCSNGFQIPCWNGEMVEIAFVLDCCDRECIEALGQPRALTGADIRVLMRAAVGCPLRWGAAAGRPAVTLGQRWHVPALKTVICSERLGLCPGTTPAYSPESNGIAEAFVHTRKRDYVSGAGSCARTAAELRLGRK